MANRLQAVTKNTKQARILVILVLLLNSVFGQWQTFTNANFINDLAIIQDQLYCATNGGLAVFALTNPPKADEISFTKVFTNTEGLPSNHCLCLQPDKTGNLWIGTNGGGLVIYNPKDNKFFCYPDSKIPTKIKSIFISSDTVLIGSENGFRLILTKQTFLNPADDEVFIFTKANHPQLVSDNILSFARTDSFFWIGTNRGLTRCPNNILDTAHWISFAHPLGDSVCAMIVPIPETLFIATEHGIAKYNGVSFDTVLFFITPVNDLAYRDNKFYLAGEKGLIRYDFQTIDTIWNEPTKILLVKSALFCGMGGGGDWGHGLRIISDTIDTLWANYYADGLASNSIFSCLTDQQGTIYACHDLSALSRFNDGYWSVFYSPLYNARILAKDSQDRIWLGHFSHRGGLSYFDQKTNSFGLLQWGEYSPRNIINALGIDRNDTKWVWSVRNNFGVIGAIDAQGNETEFNFGLISPPGRPGSYEFAFDSRNRVWLGTTEGLLMLDYRGTLFNPADDTWVIFKEQSGLPGIEVVSVACDFKDRIWVGTANGGAVLESGKFLSVNPPLSSDIKKVRVDTFGQVWFLTSRGLCRYDPQTKNWTNYTQANCPIIPNPDLAQTNFYTALHIDSKNGFILIGTQAGLAKFELKDTIEPTLTQVRVFPNPCIKGLHQSVSFESLPSNSKVFVYTLAGKKLTELRVNPNNHRATFYLGETASGIYLALIITPFGNKIEKFAIIR
uniref:T9SS type A sorting domain-containing protein n=1 Tax=candidate division WOR-3 bacterium TaxID=2052148 RepID=A0A7C6EB26_UNCW3